MWCPVYEPLRPILKHKKNLKNPRSSSNCPLNHFSPLSFIFRLGYYTPALLFILWSLHYIYKPYIHAYYAYARLYTYIQRDKTLFASWNLICSDYGFFYTDHYQIHVFSLCEKFNWYLSHLKLLRIFIF